MKQLKLYLETTVWNFLFEKIEKEKRYWTEHLLKECERGSYEMFISDIVVEEIMRAGFPRKKKLENSIKKYRPKKLEITDETKRIVKKYLNAGFIPERYIDDLNHLAIASTNDIDVLVSWNLRHIVKLTTKRYVNSINMAEGYKSIEILTPEEVVDNDERTEGRKRNP